MKQICMRCKWYKIDDAFSGYCRVEKKSDKNNSSPGTMVKHDHSCEKWIDCGQQYYIRLGWLKARNKEKKEPADG